MPSRPMPTGRDNDLDGFSSAVYMHQLLWDMGIEIAEKDIIPVTHLRLGATVFNPAAIYFFVDIQPYSMSDAVNISFFNTD